MKTKFKLISYLISLLLSILVGCKNENTSHDNPGSEEVKSLKNLFAEKKIKCEVVYGGDTLVLIFLSDSAKVHLNREAVIAENMMFNFNKELSKFNSILFELVNPFENNRLIFSAFYDKPLLEKVKEKYDHPMYHDFMSYVVDSMSSLVFFSYNGTLKAAYEDSGNALFNRDFMNILDGFMFECNGESNQHHNREIITTLLNVYNDPMFRNYPDLKKHLEYFLRYCDNFESNKNRVYT